MRDAPACPFRAPSSPIDADCAISVREAWHLRPDLQRAFPSSEPLGAAGEMGPARGSLPDVFQRVAVPGVCACRSAVDVLLAPALD